MKTHIKINRYHLSAQQLSKSSYLTSISSACVRGIQFPHGKSLFLVFGQLSRNTLHINIFIDAQSCLTLCDPMNCSLPGSFVHEISQARILDWVAISSSRKILLSQRWSPHLLHLLHWKWILYPHSHRGVLIKWNGKVDCVKVDWN